MNGCGKIGFDQTWLALKENEKGAGKWNGFGKPALDQDLWMSIKMK